MKNCILFLSIAILVGANACDSNDEGDNFVSFSEYIFSAEITNKDTHNISIDNVGRSPPIPTSTANNPAGGWRDWS